MVGKTQGSPPKRDTRYFTRRTMIITIDTLLSSNDGQIKAREMSPTDRKTCNLVQFGKFSYLFEVQRAGMLNYKIKDVS